jgi:hypothetical protein
MFSFAGYKSSNFDLDLSKWNTESISDMGSMFEYAGCESTTFSLDLSDWDTSKVTDMSYMLNGACQSAKVDIDLSNLNVDSVTNMSYMFSMLGASSAEVSIGDLSKWDTSNVTDMSNMFNSFAKSTTAATYIGEFTIPAGANINHFADGASSLSAEITISVSSGTDVFKNAATIKDGDKYLADITLIPTSETIESEAATNFITVYGIGGTTSDGNIHLPYLDFEINYTDVFVISLDSSDASQPGTVSGGTITIKNRSKYSQVQADMHATAITDSGWHLVSQDTDFTSMADNTKAVSLTATTNGIDNTDLSDSSLRVLLKENVGTENQNVATFTLAGKTCLFTEPIRTAEAFCIITIDCERIFAYDLLS